jgi:ribosomal protein L44E
MSDLTAYERRVSAALERIARKVERMQQGSGGDEGDSSQKLRDALEKERIANAQLSERVHQVKQRQETTIAQLERRLARLTEQLDLQSLEMLRLKKANTRLIDANTALRQAHVEGFPDSTLINRSISAELEALQAERRSEMAEMEEILAELKPLLAAENRSA